MGTVTSTPVPSTSSDDLVSGSVPSYTVEHGDRLFVFSPVLVVFSRPGIITKSNTLQIYKVIFCQGDCHKLKLNSTLSDRK
jgi:hypothetical protein